MPTTQSAPSTAMVPPIEFHMPSPKRGECSRPQRHVGSVGEEIEQPVAHDQQREQQGGAGGDSAPARDAGEDGSPDGGHQQAVRPGIRVEDQRREGGVAGCDADVLDAEQDEDRPEQVERGDGGDVPAERGRWSPVACWRRRVRDDRRTCAQGSKRRAALLVLSARPCMSSQ